MKIFKKVFLLFFLFTELGVNATPIDSLLNELKIAKSDSAKAYIYVLLAKHSYKSDLEKSKEYCELAIEVSKKSNQLGPLSEANNIIGVYYKNKSQFSLAHEYLTTALSIARTNGDSLTVSKVLNNLGLVYKNTGRFSEAVNLYIQSQRIAEEYGEPTDIAGAYVNLAIVYEQLGDVHIARKYTRMAYKIYLKKKDSIGMATSLNNLGMNFKVQQEYDSALYYLRQALTIKEQINFVKGKVTGLYNIGEVYMEVGLLNESLEYFKRSLELSQQLDLKQHIAKCYNLIGDAHFSLDDTEEAIKSYLMSLDINLTSGVRQGVLDNYSDLNRSYAKLGNIEKAYEYQSKLIEMKDSIFDNAMSEAIAKLRFEFDLDSKEKEIETLKSKEERNRLVLERNRLIYFFISTVVVLLFLLAISLYRSYKRQKQSLEEINRQKREIEKAHDIIKQKNDQLTVKNVDLEKEVSKRTDELNNLLTEFDLFVYKSAHDLRSPVAQILGIYNLLTVDKDNPELLGKLKNTAELMDKLLSKLSQIHVLRNKPIDEEWINIENIIQMLLEKHEAENALTDFKVKVTNPDRIKFKSDPDMVFSLIDELLSNSIEYRNKSKNLLIEIGIELSAEGVRLTFNDNGTGIYVEHQKSIFEMFFRANESSQGHGLGLYKALIIVRRLNGTIKLIKSDQNGTQFDIVFEAETERQSKVTEIDQF